MNRSKKRFEQALYKPQEELADITYYLRAWSYNGDLFTYAQYIAICGCKYEGHIANAYHMVMDRLVDLDPIEIGVIHKNLKKAGLLKEPMVIG